MPYFRVGGYDPSTNNLLISKWFNSTDKTDALSDADGDTDYTGLTRRVIEEGTSFDLATGIAREVTASAMAADIAQMADEVLIAANSYAIALGGGANFTGTLASIAGYEAVRVSVRADVASATNGLEVRWSDDNSNLILTEYFSVSAGVGFTETLPVRGAYIQIKYTNGASAQSTFDLDCTKVPRYSTIGTINAPIIIAEPNQEFSVLTSASRTTTQTSPDYTNLSCTGAILVLDITTPGTGSITLSVDGKDPVSGKYYNIITGNPETTTVTRVYRIHIGLTASANATVNDALPKTFRVVVTHNNSNAIVYSLGMILIK